MLWSTSWLPWLGLDEISKRKRENNPTPRTKRRFQESHGAWNEAPNGKTGKGAKHCNKNTLYHAHRGRKLKLALNLQNHGVWVDHSWSTNWASNGYVPHVPFPCSFVHLTACTHLQVELPYSTWKTPPSRLRPQPCVIVTVPSSSWPTPRSIATDSSLGMWKQLLPRVALCPSRMQNAGGYCVKGLNGNATTFCKWWGPWKKHLRSLQWIVFHGNDADEPFMSCQTATETWDLW